MLQNHRVATSVGQNVEVSLFTDLRDRWHHRGHPMACVDVVELVTDYLEGTMSPAVRVRFERHLSVCPHCTAYVEQVRRTVDVLGRVQPEPPDEATSKALLDAFRDFHQPDD